MLSRIELFVLLKISNKFAYYLPLDIYLRISLKNRLVIRLSKRNVLIVKVFYLDIKHLQTHVLKTKLISLIAYIILF